MSDKPKKSPMFSDEWMEELVIASAEAEEMFDEHELEEHAAAWRESDEGKAFMAALKGATWTIGDKNDG
jgi:hypothetical protein